MKYFLSFCLFLMNFLVLLGLASLVLTGPLFIIIGIILFILTSCVFSNLHRVTLMSLEAREIIDTDYQDIFQFVKSNAYSFGVKTPKVYAYKGTFKNFFVLESARDWVIVLDKDLIEQVDAEVLSDLVSFIFNYYVSGQGYLKTKILGSLIFYHYILFKLMKGLSAKNKKSHITKIISFFCLLLMRPMTLFLESLMGKDRKIFAKEGMKPLYLQRKERDSGVVLMSHVGQDNSELTKTIIEYAEAFPILNNCEFV